MARDFTINGPCLVNVRGVAALAQISSNGQTPQTWQLGLSDKEIRVVPIFHHKDINVDDFGPDVPADVIANIAEVRIIMTMIHFDSSVLNQCWANSLGGSVDNLGVPTPGTMIGAGYPLGRGIPLQTAGCNYITLSLLSTTFQRGWRFLASYLADEQEYPVGTQTTITRLMWRAIPYVPLTSVSQDPSKPKPEIKSKGAILWDRTPDTV